jgi:nucleoid-associated protein YgaU
MGNFEKLSVLVIVVIIVMILVVALYTWTDDPDDTVVKRDTARDSAAAGDLATPPRPEDDAWRRLFKEPVEPPDADRKAAVPPPAPAPKDREPAVEPAPRHEAEPHEVPDPKSGVATASDEPWTYVIKSGDTISQVAERELGTVRRQKEIFSLNPGLDPLGLREGQSLAMPPRGRTSSTIEKGGATAAAPATPAAAAGPMKPGDWYVVQHRDRLSTISKRAYGTIERWPEIWARNLSAVPDPDDVQPGTRIFLPR